MTGPRPRTAVQQLLGTLALAFNRRCRNYTQFEICVRTLLAVYLAKKIRIWVDFCQYDSPLDYFKTLAVKIARKWIPQVRKKLEDELTGVGAKFREEFRGNLVISAGDSENVAENQKYHHIAGGNDNAQKNAQSNTSSSTANTDNPNEAQLSSLAVLPPSSRTKTEVVSLLQERSDADRKLWGNSKVSGGIYHGEQDLQDLLKEAYGMFSLANPLHSDLFNNCRQMEAEVISMTCALYHGGKMYGRGSDPTSPDYAPKDQSGNYTIGNPHVVGAMTSGGTESILLAMKTFRDCARDGRNITEPNMVVSVTAHPAFLKAGQYFNIKFRRVGLEGDGSSGRVCLKKLRKAIDGNTIGIVGSCPNFPNGAMDPIEDMSAIAREKGILMHVDCCLGGFLLPFMEKAGFELPLYDFRLAGVTSISCDTHKYGFASKGSSIVMYKDAGIRQYQYIAIADWPGGIYATPAMQGSRAGGNAASCWAALMYMGEEGYVASTKQIVLAARRLCDLLKSDPELSRDLKQIGTCDTSVVCFGARDEKSLNIYGVGDCLKEKFGWNLNPLQKPASIHICVTLPTSSMINEFVHDLKASIEIVRSEPKYQTEGTVALYGMSGSVPKGIIEEVVHEYLNTCYKVI